MEKELPIKKFEKKIVTAIKENSIVVITGLTGCGKSTQVPQFIMENLAKNIGDKIICCTPTRISAFSLARYVARTRKTTLGEEIGYIIGGEKITNKNPKVPTLLEYQTIGVLKENLIHDNFFKRQSSNSNGKIYIIIDEIHERNIDQDTTLYLLKRYLRQLSQKKKKNLKIILMSATIHPKLFVRYFEDFKPIPCIHVPTILYEVKEFYLNEIVTWNKGKYSAIANRFDTFNTDSRDNLRILKDLMQVGIYLVKLVHKEKKEPREKSILIFLPGIAEILSFERLLNEHFKDDEIVVFIAHSCVGMAQQRQIFSTDKKGRRKIILSTNIAESSITIPSVSFVIDFCLFKEINMNYHNGSEELRLTWASIENMDQRRGRAGRVANGMVFRMVTKKFFDQLKKNITPEIERISLSHLILKIIKMKIGFPSSILERFITPPEETAIQKSFVELSEMNAITSKYEITSFGNYIVSLPLNLHCCALVFYGKIFRFIHETIIIAAIFDLDGILYDSFSDPLKSLRAKYYYAYGELSDVFASYFAYVDYLLYKEKNNNRINKSQYCYKNGIFLRKLNELETKLTMIYERVFTRTKVYVTPKQLVVEGKHFEFLRILVLASFRKNYVKKFNVNKTPIPEYFNKNRTVMLYKLMEYNVKNCVDFVSGYKGGFGYVKNVEESKYSEKGVFIEFDENKNEEISPVYMITKFGQSDFNKTRISIRDRFKEIPYKEASAEVEVCFLPLFFNQKVKISRFSVLSPFMTERKYKSLKCYEFIFASTHKFSEKIFFANNNTLCADTSSRNFTDILFMIFSRNIRHAKDMGNHRNYLEVVHNDTPYYFRPFLNDEIVFFVNKLRDYVLNHKLKRFQKNNSGPMEDLIYLFDYYNKFVTKRISEGRSEYLREEIFFLHQLSFVRDQYKVAKKYYRKSVDLISQFVGKDMIDEFNADDRKVSMYVCLREWHEYNNSKFYNVIKKAELGYRITFWMDEYENLKLIVCPPSKESYIAPITCKGVMNQPNIHRQFKFVFATALRKIKTRMKGIELNEEKRVIIIRKKDETYDTSYDDEYDKTVIEEEDDDYVVNRQYLKKKEKKIDPKKVLPEGYERYDK